MSDEIAQLALPGPEAPEERILGYLRRVLRCFEVENGREMKRFPWNVKGNRRNIKDLGRYCHYLGLYFCTSCHQSEIRVIPARVAERWDFEPKKAGTIVSGS